MRAAVRRSAAAAGLAAAAVCGSAAPAAAHTDLVGSSPQAEAQLTQAPESVTLTFAQSVGARFAVVTVTASDGSSWVSGDPSVAGETITQPLRPLSDGTYTAAYRVVAADGHPIAGTLSFDVVAGPAEVAAAAPGDAAADAGEVLRVEAAAVVTTEPGSAGLLLPLAGVGGVGLLVVAGAVTARRRAAASSDGSR